MSQDQRNKKTRQPPIFWLSIAGAVVGLASISFGLATARDGDAGAIWAALFVTLALVLVILAGYWLSIRNRMRNARQRLPTALLIPVTVGLDLARATARLAEVRRAPLIQLKRSSYAAIAFDDNGVHFISSVSGPWAKVPSSNVTVAGLANDLVGTRSMTAIVLRLDTAEAPIELPLVPMRLRGNPMKALRHNELVRVSSQIRAALSGQASPGWDY